MLTWLFGTITHTKQKSSVNTVEVNNLGGLTLREDNGKPIYGEKILTSIE